MERRIVFVFLLLFWNAPEVLGQTFQTITGGDFHATVGDTNTQYKNVMGGSGAWATSPSIRQSQIPVAGKIQNLRCEMSSAAGGSGSWQCGVQLDGLTGPACSMTAASGDTQCSNTSTVVSVSVGQEINVQVIPTSSPGQRSFRWAFDFLPADLDDTVFLGGSQTSLPLSGAARFMPLHGGKLTLTEFEVQTVFPTGGTLRDLDIEITQDPNPKTFVFTAMHNGSATSLTCSISTPNATCSDTANTITIVAGDTASIRVEVSGGFGLFVAFAKTGLNFQPTTRGDFIIAGSSDNALNASTTEYAPGAAEAFNLTSTEANTETITTTILTLKHLYIELSFAPGAGKNYKFTSRKNNVAGDLTCTITGSTATSCNDTTGTNSYTDFDELGIEIVPTSTPTTPDFIWSFMGQHETVALSGIIRRTH